MEVLVFDVQSDLQIDPESIKQAAQAVVQYEKRKYDEVAIHFVSTEEICKLHGEFFDDPSPTDCISFPVDLKDEEDDDKDDDEEEAGAYKVMGDVFVCPQVAIEYATENNGNPYWETTLYLVHGLLHLMGYDDIEDEDEKKMRAAETRHMRNLTHQHLLLKPLHVSNEL